VKSFNIYNRFQLFIHRLVPHYADFLSGYVGSYKPQTPWWFVTSATSDYSSAQMSSPSLVHAVHHDCIRAFEYATVDNCYISLPAQPQVAESISIVLHRSHYRARKPIGGSHISAKCNAKHILFKYMDVDRALPIHSTYRTTSSVLLPGNVTGSCQPQTTTILLFTRRGLGSVCYYHVHWRCIPTVTLPPVSRLKNFSRNALDKSSSAGTCYLLHAILVMIHVILVISYIFHWEHRAILPFTTMNNNFWPVVLSVSLQAFYTVCDLL
jgi:hypothetical protein